MNVKIIPFDQFFSQVNHGIPQQVADLIRRCQITIQLQGTQVFLHNLRSLNFSKCILCHGVELNLSREKMFKTWRVFRLSRTLIRSNF